MKTKMRNIDLWGLAQTGIGLLHVPYMLGPNCQEKKKENCGGG